MGLVSTPQMRLKALEGTDGGTVTFREADAQLPSTLRLLNAERSYEIFPILLEEIVKLGFARAFILTADFETGEIIPSAAIKCSDSYLQKFKTSLYSTDNPIVTIFHTLKPAVVPNNAPMARGMYCHPMLYKNRNMCWEAERMRKSECLAQANSRESRRLSLEQQVCRTCDMRGYASVVVVEPPKKTPAKVMNDLAALIELSNRYLSRLFKVEHYYNRMRDMDQTIDQMNTVMM